MAEKQKKEQSEKSDDMTAKNLAIYEKARLVPESAIKPITSGRLKGKSDINPVYRIKRMTEIFGPCDGNEVKAFTFINLYIKLNGEWSDAIPGIGGASFVSQESRGSYVSDECYKMSLTDALSVSMKALGIAADIYYAKDGKNLNPGDSKYREIEGASGQSAVNFAFTGAQLKQAIAEIEACTTNTEYTEVWNKYQNTIPALCVKGTEFYNACIKKANELHS